MTEQDRRNLLMNYMATEPVIVVNCETFRVSVDYGQTDFVYFFATSVYQRTVGAITKLLRSSWEAIDCGLKMAYAYNVVLETLERGVQQTGGNLRYA